MDRERKLKDSWNANAAAWTDVVRSGGIESRALITDQAVFEAVADLRPESVLDVGCGEGWLASRLDSADVRVTGFDASEALVIGARERSAGSFHVLDYDSFARDPYQLGSGFDVVVCNFSLLGARTHPLLKAMADVLAPRGKLVIQTVHPFTVVGEERYEDGWREEDFASMSAAFEVSMPWYFRTVGSWVRALNEAGFRVADCLEPVHPDTGRPLSLIWIAGLPKTVPDSALAP